MTARELIELLEQWDTLPVKVRFSLPNEENWEGMHATELDGQYAEITDERSVLFENGCVVIIADALEDD